ncbi:MAG TPA: hypothetical protein DGT23_20945 [Micromonosporaceae bacterium]|nr:hypothetical protein [Micromonosporaceae bacterium]
MRKLMWGMWGSIAGLAAVLAVVAWVAWPPPASPEPPRAREFRNYDLCLLTGQEGIGAGVGATAWAGLQEVSKQTNVRLSYLSVSGEQTEARARQYVATQVQQQCGIIVAVGKPQVDAVGAMSGKYPTVKFVALTDDVTSTEVTAKVNPLIP